MPSLLLNLVKAHSLESELHSVFSSNFGVNPGEVPFDHALYIQY